jgi:hypothetical protein
MSDAGIRLAVIQKALGLKPLFITDYRKVDISWFFSVPFDKRASRLASDMYSGGAWFEFQRVNGCSE